MCVSAEVSITPSVDVFSGIWNLGPGGQKMICLFKTAA